MSTAGDESLLHSFTPTEGQEPTGLVAARGMLYGTAFHGGLTGYNAGTVFAASKKGAVHVLHAFGAAGDGANPVGRLLFENGTLYGTTKLGAHRVRVPSTP
jgi:uncharacterized repeat protein (TIGR03803 family)